MRRTPYSLGQRQMPQEVQTEALCRGFGGTIVPCVENRRWTVRGVHWMTAWLRAAYSAALSSHPGFACEISMIAADPTARVRREGIR